jgi:G3E family GTPase
VKGEVPLPLLLSVGLFESDRHDHSYCDHDHGHCEHEHGHGHKHEHHDHSGAIEGFTSLSFRSDKPLGLRKFQNFLDNQLPASVYRAKGILWFNESERRHVFHLAGKRFSIDDSDWAGERSNQIVLIGRELDHDKLRRQLSACLAPQAAAGFKNN